MPQAERALNATRAPNRVTYQGVTYTICTSCFDVIGSARSEENLLALEDAHRCAAMDNKAEYDYIPRVSKVGSEG